MLTASTSDVMTEALVRLRVTIRVMLLALDERRTMMTLFRSVQIRMIFPNTNGLKTPDADRLNSQIYILTMYKIAHRHHGLAPILEETKLLSFFNTLAYRLPKP